MNTEFFGNIAIFRPRLESELIFRKNESFVRSKYHVVTYTTPTEITSILNTNVYQYPQDMTTSVKDVSCLDGLFRGYRRESVTA